MGSALLKTSSPQGVPLVRKRVQAWKVERKETYGKQSLDLAKKSKKEGRCELTFAYNLCKGCSYNALDVESAKVADVPRVERGFSFAVG
jgi:hypothetical protein